ncbi:ATPase AAA [Kroppenstedtia guangzhouensis]|uniref:ATPase AAA n=1 Tax=Kroppenstedtia guangzhouensis TaxID=1274356 RepID=A0ABQ1GUK4_9BACL|nr:BREX-3 system P-loop-containing protein BrxF [Kroppenstedtia guangzhouensis]GGA50451.1 ATPase AAA [Kroppenstedtia guangzhouensis]
MNSLLVQLGEKMDQVRSQRHRLIFLVHTEEKKQSLTELLKQLDAVHMNLSLLLSERLKEHPLNKRPLKVGRMVSEIVHQTESETLCFDQIELIFHPDLQQDPLRLFESVSGNKTILVCWPGEYDGNALSYAQPGHPEYMKIPFPQAFVLWV